MPELLNDEIKNQIREVFNGLDKPVQVEYFGKENDCDYCAETQQLLEEVAALSDRLEVSVHDIDVDAALAAQYGIEGAPSFTLTGKEDGHLVDYGVHYLGIPSGHEFTSLINDLIMVSSRKSGLSDATREFLKSLKDPVHLQVFITPT
ncbi:MAG: hypothetical protein M1281_01275 [Chloroflexi bacterium]|nr:hypothetical protein [Chloroflexota bacterium]